MPRMVLRSLSGKEEYGAEEIRYRANNGELLEVIPNHSSFNRSVQDWKRAFDSGRDKPAFLRYKDFLLPDLDGKNLVSLNEGDTPLYLADKKLREYFGVRDLLLKHEGMNPTLSFKDRGMVAGVSWAKQLGVKRVACASTGDTSASMAAYAARAGIESLVLLPHEKISFEQLSQAISYGAKTLGLKTDFDGCMKLVQQLTQKHGIYLLNSMNSIRIEGQKAIGLETLHQLKWEVPDWFVIPVGNAGNVSALCKGLRELKELGIIEKLPRVAGVETMAANPLYNSFANNWSGLEPVLAKKTYASAIQIGDPVSFEKARRELMHFKGVMEQVSDAELMDAKAIVDASGISVCPNSGAALAGLKKLAEKGTIKEDEKTVVILTAHGAKFSNAIADYHKDKKNNFANTISVLDASIGAIEKDLGLF
ncbi:MAG: threonine synthase [archaeon]|nr:threonine synthase [archaeon]